jgi:hypothetical protein
MGSGAAIRDDQRIARMPIGSSEGPIRSDAIRSARSPTPNFLHKPSFLL